MKKIALTTKEQLDIYMSPTRQKLLRLLSLEGMPMTPKQLADRLEISASGVQHHIKKLLQLGVVELDHTETINGIHASFYKPAQATVSIGLSESDQLSGQKDVLVQNNIAQVYDGFRNQMKKRMDRTGEKDINKLQSLGDVLTGVVYLDESQSKDLIRLITGFLEQHSVPEAGSRPWEYALIAYEAGEIGDE